MGGVDCVGDGGEDCGGDDVEDDGGFDVCLDVVLEIGEVFENCEDVEVEGEIENEVGEGDGGGFVEDEGVDLVGGEVVDV